MTGNMKECLRSIVGELHRGCARVIVQREAVVAYQFEQLWNLVLPPHTRQMKLAERSLCRRALFRMCLNSYQIRSAGSCVQ